MNKERVHGADGYKAVALDPPSGVENEHRETLALRIEERVRPDVFVPVSRSLLRCLGALHLIGTETFAKGHKLPLVGLVRVADGSRALARKRGDGLGERSALPRRGEDPVNDAERRRNDQIFTLYQHNRNPFVDHPEWVREAFHPRLTIAASAQVITIRWPAEFVSALLETQTNLLQPWRIVPALPTLTNGFWQVTLPPDNLALFRLHLP